jgi:hypothetical protein
MKTLIATLSVLSLAVLSGAQAPPEVCRKLQAVQLLAAQEPQEDAVGKLTGRWLEEVLHLLRGPAPDGTYRWARLAESDARTEPRGVDVEDPVQTLTVPVEDWYGFHLRCPRKKNLFWGNAPVMVQKVLLVSGGVERILVENHRLDRGEELLRKFGAIVPEGRLEITFERLPGGERSAHVELSGLLAGLADAPENPQAPLVGEVRAMLATGAGGAAFPGHLERALDRCQQGIRRELEFILYLLNGTEGERADGRRRLEALIRTL